MKLYGAIDLHSNNNVTVLIASVLTTSSSASLYRFLFRRASFSTF